MNLFRPTFGVYVLYVTKIAAAGRGNFRGVADPSTDWSVRHPRGVHASQSETQTVHRTCHFPRNGRGRERGDDVL